MSVKLMDLRTVVLVITPFILSDCGAAQPDQAVLSVPVISDAELAELVPDFVDAQSMPWLVGTWELISQDSSDATDCANGGYLNIQPSGYVFEISAVPEPGRIEGKRVTGTANVSKGVEPGYFHLTPPQWSDTYLRLKPLSRDQLAVRLYTYAPDDIEWVETEAFDLARCD